MNAHAKRIVFCGSGDVAVPILRRLHGAGVEIAAVYTQPPRPAGRGGRLRPTPVESAATELALAPVQAENINDARHADQIRALAPALMVVVDFGQKIGAAVRAIPPRGAVNVHLSLLPKLRGAAPVNWAIIRGHARTGATVFELVDAMDAGPIYGCQGVEIDPAETAEQLHSRLAQVGADLLLDLLPEILAGRTPPAPQDESEATAAPKLAKRDGWIDFNDHALAIVNRIHGVWPWPGARARFFSANRAKPTDVIFARARAHIAAEPADGAPGVLADDGTIHAPGGRVEILELKVAGKRLMDWTDFVNGYRAAAGDRFESPGGSS